LNSGNYKAEQKTYPQKNIQDKRSYFRGHYKISGHSTQRCFKLHGYPPEHRLYKGRKVVVVVQAERNSDIKAS